MKQLEQTWRWFGPDDPVSLAHIRQAGASGIVTALHHVPVGAPWEKKDILQRKEQIEAAGLRWSVVESVPVHDDIKRQQGDWKKYIQHYQQSLRNLGECGIKTVTYNFMPVLDWTRTDLSYALEDGATALRFDPIALAAFDLFMLERKAAEEEYSTELKAKATAYYDSLPTEERTQLAANLIAGLPGSEEGYDLARMKAAVDQYQGISPEKFRQHLYDFLDQIIPVAEEAGIYLAIHPDDPPFSILGLPRVVSTADDLAAILAVKDSPNNGLCFCTGSLGARLDNDLTAMMKQFRNRINFLHLRSVQREADGSFYEANHLEGTANMYEIMSIAAAEQQVRKAPIPMRPDHGHQMLDDLQKKTNPGYSAIGRLRGLAELRGLEWGILQNEMRS